ncbi:MAG TPA: putative peptidoglycan glycosyltransferase FtsW [Candidatus Paceibacterota bacterium]|nr:putative peptidoglycan glycosyltransferase FtsW [Candidatus Paceibacterota bacterium]
MQKERMDKWLLWLTITLVAFGFVVFFSASLGLLAKSGQAEFASVVFTQLVFGIIGGFIFMYTMSSIPYQFWRKYSLYFFVGSLFLTLMVFVPHIGFSHGGATRWINLGPFTFQPSEFLKISFVIYFATWATNAKKHIQSLKYGVLPLGVMLGVTGLILLKEPDTDALMIITSAAIGMFIVAGGRWKHFIGIFVTGLLLGVFLFFSVGYIHNRVIVFFHPQTEIYGAGYQVHQAMIAIGSGKIFGRGLGQGVQKFTYLPEAIGDSVFAVLGEELGFLGGLFLIGLFVAFAARGFIIANRAKDQFGRLLAVGIVIIIVAQAYLNISSMLGIFPLSGLPLTFVSHGGSALLIALGMVGILLNVSRTAKKTPLTR